MCLIKSGVIARLFFFAGRPAISKVSRFEIEDHDFMTVENLTSFNRIRRTDNHSM